MRAVYLDQLTLRLLNRWLVERHARWPDTVNPYLLVNCWTAYRPSTPPVSCTGLRGAFPDDVHPRQLWTDRVLDEARRTEDPVHLVRVFGLIPHTAVRYVDAAHPDKASPRIR